MTTTAAVNVNLASPGITYSRDIFGHFIEHFHRQIYGGVFDPGSELSDARGFRLDVIEALRTLSTPVVRWPGGCFVSGYHWLDGVGPNRRSRYDKAWRVTDPNTFGTHEFVEWCRAIGAEPYICTNAGTGNPEEMSDWVEYCNLPAGLSRWADLRAENGSPEPFNVRFWSIGNENYGDWEMGAKTPEEWSSLVRESAKMMLHVDENIQLLTAARADLDWTLPLISAAGRYLNMIAIHGYWDSLGQVDQPSDYLTAIGRSLEPQDDIDRTKHILGAAGLGSDVGIAFDEWNLRSWHHPNGNTAEIIAARDKNDNNATYTMADALFTASFLNTCLRNADTVKMANIAPTINTRGPLYVHSDGIVRRTTFHVMAMYSQLLGSRVLPSNATSSDLCGTSVPVIDHLATTDDTRSKITILLINRDPDTPINCEVRLGGHPLTGAYDGTRLDGPSVDAYNDISSPNTVQPAPTKLEFIDGITALPPHSLSIMNIQLPIPFDAGEANLPSGTQATWQLIDKTWTRI